MSFRVVKSQDTTQAATTAIAIPDSVPAVRVTNADLTNAIICEVKFGESDAVVAAAGDTAIMPGKDVILAVPAGATHLAVLAVNGRVNLAWGSDGHG